MKKVLSMFLFFILIGCQTPDTSVNRYQPEKAGAKIVKTYEIGSKISYQSDIESRVLLSFYNDNYYIFYTEITIPCGI